MKERPILFSSPMVRAILAGQKTQTRRVVKPQPDHDASVCRDVDTGLYSLDILGRCHGDLVCPYGETGDRMWVRETWQVDAPRDGTWPDVEFYGCKGAPLSWIPSQYQTPQHVLFRSTWDGQAITWRPSIHMPRWASRLTLEVTDVRVQRVQEISEEDAKAEGAQPGCGNEPDSCARDNCRCDVTCPEAMSYRGGFRELWDSINAKRGFGWDANPWVWAITFLVCTDAERGTP